MSSIGLSTQKIKELKIFLQQVKENPQLLHAKELDFFRKFLEDFGASIPENTARVVEEEIPIPSKNETEQPAPQEEEIKFVDPDLMEPDTADGTLEYGDSSIEVTEDMMETANNLKAEALSAQREGKLQESINLFTQAIKSNPKSAILFGSRAQVLLEMKKPNAAIKDCDIAIKKNPDSAKPYKVRARAHRAIGHYEQALKDIQIAQKLDWDETSDKLEHEYKDLFDKTAYLRKKPKTSSQTNSQSRSHSANPFEGANPFGSGMGGMGGMGGIPPEFLSKIMSDPEVISLMSDPSAQAKIQAAMSDPSKLAELQKDPKFANLISKFMKQ